MELEVYQATISFGLDMKEGDHCMYAKRHNDCFVILTLYVSDILLVWNNLEKLNETKSWLSSIFLMKDVRQVM